MATAPDHIDDDAFDDDGGVRFVDDDEAREIFDRNARRLLGISGDEFLRRYDAGAYNGPLEDREIDKVRAMIMMLDFVR
jgi:hypothetical protein